MNISVSISDCARGLNMQSLEVYELIRQCPIYMDDSGSKWRAGRSILCICGEIESSVLDLIIGSGLTFDEG